MHFLQSISFIAQISGPNSSGTYLRPVENDSPGNAISVVYCPFCSTQLRSRAPDDRITGPLAVRSNEDVSRSGALPLAISLCVSGHGIHADLSVSAPLLEVLASYSRRWKAGSTSGCKCHLAH